MSTLPFITVNINGLYVKTLVDSGCQQSVVTKDLINRLGLKTRGPGKIVKMLNGQTTLCYEEVDLKLDTGQCDSLILCCLVAPELVCGCSLIMGVDGIHKLGGVTISATNSVSFGNSVGLPLTPIAGVREETRDTSLYVEDSDFTAKFDGVNWTISWAWKSEQPTLRNQCAEYAVSDDQCKQKYEKEIEQWISDSWLVKHNEAEHGKVSGVIPLMAVVQSNKAGKVRPVMDYSRELNKHVHSVPGSDVAVCQEKLREWRKFGDSSCMLDLQKAYLQLHVDKSLHRFQAVRFKGTLYVMTRMGFGLNIAPKVMSRILTKVLSLDETICKGTDHYIDDILVNEKVVSVWTVKEHLQKYGLISKEPEKLTSARVLGLRVESSSLGKLRWSRDSEPPPIQSEVTKRNLYSICGKYVGHYPVAKWLCVACSYMKRQVNDYDWDTMIPSNVKTMLNETVERVKQHDPVCGQWSVQATQHGKVWCDASSLAVGACVEIDGQIVEDATWLRSVDDGAHINVAELEAVIKAVNMALKWKLKHVNILSDSATVCGWVRSVLNDSKRPKVAGLSEMIVKRRLSLLSDLIDENGLDIQIQLVKSEENKADELTRVPRKWLNKNQCSINVLVSDKITDKLRNLHDTHHLGVDRTFHLAKAKWGSDICKKDVEQVVQQCHVCKRVDPAPVQWETGHISVTEDWFRLAMDITHYNGTAYLSIIDCGPSRYAIWRKLRNETSNAVKEQLESIFCERGSPAEVLSDNGPCFRAIKSVLEKWNVEQLFSCAYRASGNGLIERNHRTIKRMLARSGGTVNEMVFWYNNTPNSEGVVPSERLFKYMPHNLPEGTKSPNRDISLNPYKVGDEVYVKPGTVRCTSVWRTGIITDIVSNTAVKVDGMTRHVGDIRFCWRQSTDQPSTDYEVDFKENTSELDIAQYNVNHGGCDSDSMGNDDNDNNDGGCVNVNQDENVYVRSVRNRKPPAWLADFMIN